jgi:hypothetical protein
MTSMPFPINWIIEILTRFDKLFFSVSIINILKILHKVGLETKINEVKQI